MFSRAITLLSLFSYYLFTIGYCADLKFRSTDSTPLPKFGDYYSVGGVITLPYAEINEPFLAWFDATANKSRIDFYGGIVKTFQRGDVGKFGAMYKLAPMSTETVQNVMGCFLVDGTAPGPSRNVGDSVVTQAVLPDLTGFKFSGTNYLKGQNANIWVKTVTTSGRKDVYTMWTSINGGAPLRYDMIGYDNLLGSHYDRYYIDYVNFNKIDRPIPTIFEVPNNKTCGPFPGPGSHAEHLVQVNPMSELVHKERNEDHLDSAFDRFKKHHEIQYKNNTEQLTRRHIFRQNVRYIDSINRKGLTYRVAVNHLADKTDAELKLLRGRQQQKVGTNNGGAPVTFTEAEKVKIAQGLPDSFDWRLNGAVQPVKDQAICGSCWSFGTTGALEGAVFTKHGLRVRLSQQQLMDCSWGFGNNACDGGEDFRAYQYVMKHGISLESNYGSYLGQDGYCHQDKVQSALKLNGWMNITQGDENQLMTVLATKGPVSVGIDASHKSLSYYSYGVYYEPKCRKDPDGLDHSVLAVGYGTMNGQKYWLVKNSWSFYWGNDGYVLMSQKENNCGVATAATIPDVA